MDRSFLAAGSVPVSSGLATAVVALGETFELSVVAEGIEFPDQLSTLRELGCDLGQGYYFSKPMDSSATIEYLRSFPAASIAAAAGQPDDSRPVDAT
jgi:EAL domain-containing protein (putative c-di-GMP-specific phosphodiesterase class I)